VHGRQGLGRRAMFLLLRCMLYVRIGAKCADAKHYGQFVGIPNPLTSSQLQWRKFAIWANDPNTTSEMIRQRRQSDRNFAEFYRRSLEREAQETESTQFQLAGLPSGQVVASDKLQRFAKLYRETSTDRLKPRGGYITLSDEFRVTKTQFDNFATQSESFHTCLSAEDSKLIR
jgi:hypothetical protein